MNEIYPEKNQKKHPIFSFLRIFSGELSSNFSFLEKKD
jgi:hypothetical protein